MEQTLIEAIATAIGARHRCAEINNMEWFDRWTQRLSAYAAALPSGSGIDNGTKIDVDRSTANRILLTLSYHHLNDNGFYDGWTDHTITVRPAFIGRFTLTISGRDRNETKDYLAEVYAYALSEKAPD